jgi:uncharacterized protein
MMLQLDSLFISATENKGRGVFTKEKLAAETVIEIAPVLVMTLEERIHLDQTLLHDYIFEWGEKKDQCAFALGWVSIYNHSYASNCEHFMDFETESIFIKTIRDIEAGEELTINYNGDWNETKKVWFEIKS